MIPCYNAAPFLERSVRSVRAQTVPAREILVVDDGSTDDTRHIANALGVRLVANMGAKGPSGARNTGASEASGKWIAFLDADDEWLPRHLEVLSDLAHQAQADVVCGNVVDDSFPPDDAATAAGRDWQRISHALLLRENVIVQSAAMVRREALRSAAGYDEHRRYAEDYELWLRLSAREVVMALSDHVTCVRHAHPAQASRAIMRMKTGAWEARTRHAFAHPAAGLSEHERSDRLASLRQAYLHDLRDAWYFGHRGLKRLLEELAVEDANLRAALTHFRASHRAWPVARAVAWARALSGRMQSPDE